MCMPNLIRIFSANDSGSWTWPLSTKTMMGTAKTNCVLMGTLIRLANTAISWRPFKLFHGSNKVHPGMTIYPLGSVFDPLKQNL